MPPPRAAILFGASAMPTALFLFAALIGASFPAAAPAAAAEIVDAEVAPYAEAKRPVATAPEQQPGQEQRCHDRTAQGWTPEQKLQLLLALGAAI
jgi:hypothetical protein